MIRTITYRARLDGKDGEKVAEGLRAHVAKLVRTRNTIRGVKVSVSSDVLDLHLRMSGVDRWRIAREARKIGSFLLASQRLAFTRPLNPVLEVTEPSKRHLTLEQGRVPQSVTGGRPSTRTARPEDPGPWWGDELPQ